MHAADRLEQVRKIAEEVSAREGCVLYDVEFVGAMTGRTLRVYIDRADGQGVSITDCSNVSRGLNLLLDVEDVVPGGRYSLEVSSPGMERHLRRPEHFEKAIGQTIHVKTFAPLLDFNPAVAALGKAKQIQGVLNKVQAESIGLTASVGEIEIPLKTVTKANIVVDYDTVLSGSKSN